MYIYMHILLYKPQVCNNYIVNFVALVLPAIKL